MPRLPGERRTRLLRNPKRQKGPAARAAKAALSAQQTIPYIAMHPDGVCQLPGGLYSKTVEYEDINYAVASTEDQTAIFGGWSSFLNYFDSSLPFQLSFINRRSRDRSRYKVNIPEANDAFNSVRDDYTKMLKTQIAKSNNGIERSKYITVCLPADSVADARPRLERVEADVTGNLHRLGVQSEPLDGRGRLALLHGQMHPGSRETFRFSWKDIPQTGMGTKDYIAPDSFDFRDSRTFRIGRYWGAASYLQILASELSDKLLAEILEMDAELTVTMHIQTVDQLKAIKTIKGKISDIGRMKAEEQKKAVRAGYDMEILPPDLITFSKDAAELLADLQSRNERMFLLTFTVINLAPTRQKLENDVFTVGGIAQKYNCALRRLDWQQEQGFVSSLVLGYNGIEIQRGMTTSSTAIFIPFMTRELRMGGQALYYGMNALSHNVIMADRKKLKSANGLYLGSTGSGKSFAAKRELLNVFLTTNDRIIIVDPMGEYVPLARRLGGQIIEIAPDSPNHLNPMDIQLNLNGGDSPLSMKADFLLSLCELVLGGKEGLQPIERTVIDRCVRLVYREMALGLEPEKTPLLQDLYEELLKQPEPEAQRVATALELYCTGSLNLFNHPTNVRTDNRVVCIVLKGMGENLRKIAMHITDEFVTQAVEDNFREGVATWCYFDEFHVLLRDQLTASYFVAVWKMLRKKGCVPSALTQNVKDLLASREIEAILDNTDFMVLLSQAQSDRAILAKQLGISEHQLSYITHSNSGEGLLFYGSVTIPFVDRFPRGEIYDLLTTRPEDMAHERTDK
ncbi:VirB4-like conjugal transfer ATPase, CD1110 family [Dysosmobacter welbionis]